MNTVVLSIISVTVILFFRLQPHSTSAVSLLAPGHPELLLQGVRAPRPDRAQAEEDRPDKLLQVGESH